MLENVRGLDVPVPCRGGQMLWDVPCDVGGIVAHMLDQEAVR